VRDFTFVRDTAKGFLAVADCPDAIGDTFNLGTGVGLAIDSVAQTLLRLAGSQARLRPEEARIRPADGEVMRLVCDPSKVEKLTGWRPLVSLEEGLRQVLEFWHRQPVKSPSHAYAI